MYFFKKKKYFLLNKYITKVSEELYQQKKEKITTGPKNDGSPSFVGE